MASGPITSWQVYGETMETVTNFIFLGSKITADGNCSHEIKKFLLLGRKAMANLDSILKSRDITLPTEVDLIKAMVFSYSHIRMWELDREESCAPKTWCFWTVVLEKLLRVLWTARRSNPSVLKEISPEYSLEGLTLKLKLQYFGHFMQRTDSLVKKTLMLGKIQCRRRRGQHRMKNGPSPTRWTWVWASSGSWWWTGNAGMLLSIRSQRIRHE